MPEKATSYSQNRAADDIASVMDHLEIPRDLGRDKAAALIRAAGHKASNVPLAAAIKERKLQLPTISTYLDEES